MGRLSSRSFRVLLAGLSALLSSTNNREYLSIPVSVVAFPISIFVEVLLMAIAKSASKPVIDLSSFQGRRNPIQLAKVTPSSVTLSFSSYSSIVECSLSWVWKTKAEEQEGN